MVVKVISEVTKIYVEGQSLRASEALSIPVVRAHEMIIIRKLLQLEHGQTMWKEQGSLELNLCEK